MKNTASKTKKRDEKRGLTKDKNKSFKKGGPRSKKVNFNTKVCIWFGTNADLTDVVPNHDYLGTKNRYFSLTQFLIIEDLASLNLLLTEKIKWKKNVFLVPK